MRLPTTHNPSERLMKFLVVAILNVIDKSKLDALLIPDS